MLMGLANVVVDVPVDAPGDGGEYVNDVPL